MLPNFSMRELIEAGVHFGHKTRRWNPRMAPFIYGVRNDTHIIDLGKTVPLLHSALNAVREVAAGGGKILFVGTKHQAGGVIAEAAKRCGQFYINERWLGGTLTNWKTIQNSIRRLRELDNILGQEKFGFTKKELLNLNRDRAKLEASLGGIKNMGGVPQMLFIIDVVKEDIAVKEAAKLGIPIVAIVDTNASIEGINYPIPGNDDATRAIQLYCNLIADTILDGRSDYVARTGRDDSVAEEPQFDQAEQPAEEETDDKKTKSSTKKEAMAAEAKKAAAKKSKSKKDETGSDPEDSEAA
ncbi:MAG: 30S ribosomal protein S2 [Rickettsiales bacterium]